MSEEIARTTRVSKRILVQTSLEPTSAKRIATTKLFDCRKKYDCILLQIKNDATLNKNEELHNKYIYYPIHDIIGKDFHEVIFFITRAYKLILFIGW